MLYVAGLVLVLELGKHISGILLYLLEHDAAKKSDLAAIIPSPTTYTRYVDLMEKEGLIEVKELRLGRRVYRLSLTEKGREMATALFKAEKGSEEIVIDRSDWNLQKESWESVSALTHVNVLDDHITLRERNYEGSGKERIVMIYTKVNGKGIMRLWCDVDDSFHCWHVQYAWTLPDVQEMVQLQKERGNLNSNE